MLRQYEARHIVEHVNDIAPYFIAKLDALKDEFSFIKERRGSGLMQGLVFEGPVAPVIAAAMDKGLILINAGANILRFVPPLVIEREDIDQMYDILRDVLGSL